MTARLNAIVEFSGLGEQVYHRVSTYSRGMYSRLASAAVLNLEPNILLVDDDFAVGDGAFQAKVNAKLSSLLDGGATLLIAGHRLSSLKAQCQRAIWLDKGRLRADGSAEEVLGEYASWIKAASVQPALEQRLDQAEDPEVITQSSVFRSWDRPPITSTGPKLINGREGTQGNLVSFAVHRADRKQAIFSVDDAKILCVAAIETLKSNVVMDAQIELLIGRQLVALVQPSAPFRISSPGQHRISVTLNTDQFPDQIYWAQIKLVFLDASGLATEMAVTKRRFLVAGRHKGDDRRRRFETHWPPRRLSDPLLDVSARWEQWLLSDDHVEPMEGEVKAERVD
jgi:hypothetical protein